MTRVALIDYGAGNLRSVERALMHVGAQVVRVTEGRALAEASHIVLPGVGAFKDCMEGLTGLPGMRDALEQQVRGDKKPFLGICVGMQLLATRGLEFGETQGLGWIEGDVVAIDAAPGLKIPHMGWNTLSLVKPEHALLEGIAEGDHVYFVHSYHVKLKEKKVLAAEVPYGQPVTAMVVQGNIAGTQFHPEKSQKAGLALLGNFLKWQGK